MEEESNGGGPVFLGLDAYDTTAGAEEGAVMEVISPNGEVLRWPDGRPWTITYYGADSKRFQKLILQQADRNNAVAFRTRNPQSAQKFENDILEQVVVATKSWDIPLGDGTPAKQDPKEYRAAYLKYRWLLDQGKVFVDARANFLKIAPKPS
jgi:hypothetical protein